MGPYVIIEAQAWRSGVSACLLVLQFWASWWAASLAATGGSCLTDPEAAGRVFSAPPSRVREKSSKAAEKDDRRVRPAEE